MSVNRQSNIRGAKNVVNGAIKSMKSAICEIAGKNIYLKIFTELTQVHKKRQELLNKRYRQGSIGTHASIATWMCLELHYQVEQYKFYQILKKYVEKMQDKLKNKTHKNQRYNEEKGQKILNFIQSANILIKNPKNYEQSLQPIYDYKQSTKIEIILLESEIQKLNMAYQLLQNKQILNLNYNQNTQNIEENQQRIEIEQERNSLQNNDSLDIPDAIKDYFNTQNYPNANGDADDDKDDYFPKRKVHYDFDNIFC